MEHRPRKRFGQNFLRDEVTIQRIVAAVDAKPGEHLVEIGPGRGAITTGLLKAAGHLDAIELDRDLIEPLARLCVRLGDLSIHNADALRFNLGTLYRGERLRLVGNLPYYISTPLLFHLLHQGDFIHDMHFMLQKEVVERITAPPGSKIYGRLSVMIQVYCQAEALFPIKPEAFIPVPKVESAFLRLTPYRPLPATVLDPSFLARLVAQAFAQRRKTLRNSLKGIVSAEQLRAHGLDPQQRAEEVSAETFVQLSNAACNTRASP